MREISTRCDLRDSACRALRKPSKPAPFADLGCKCLRAIAQGRARKRTPDAPIKKAPADKRVVEAAEAAAEAIAADEAAGMFSDGGGGLAEAVRAVGSNRLHHGAAT